MENIPSSPELDSHTPPSQPREHSFFHSPHIVLSIVIIIAFFTLSGISFGGYLLINKTTPPRSLTINTIPSPVISMQPTTQIISTTPSQKLMVSSWQSYKDHYNEISFQYPTEWLVENVCAGEGAGEGCVHFFLNENDEKNFASIIGISNNYPPINIDKKEILIENNFKIPALESTEKAAIYQTQDGTIVIRFIHNTIPYTFSLYSYYMKKHSIDAESAKKILQQMAKSVTFLNEPYSCKNPALAPLSSFPESFTLYNGHESDGTDPINSINPYSRPLAPSETSREPSSDDKTRIFMVNYLKSGSVFTNSEFGNMVTPIQGYVPEKTNFTNSTSLFHVNCIDTQDDGPGAEEIYHISSDDEDPFALHLYGYKNNSSDLWGKSQWNVKLLTQTRNEVYARMGNQWQKYIATGYFVSVVNAYGGKPAIYLYPKKTTSIDVTIHPIGTLIKTDDLYNTALSGWKITARPDGTINETYPYLYYEALFPFERPSRGYIVPYKNLFPFTDHYVKKLGLNQKESNEFISYWKKILSPAPFYFVSHLNISTINTLYPLYISPQPDSLLRVEIYFEPLAEKITVLPPIFPSSFERIGFTAVEWGAIYNH